MVGDGKVIISTELDNSGIEKGLDKISGMLGGMKNVLAKIADAVVKTLAIRKIAEFAAEASQAAMTMSDAILPFEWPMALMPLVVMWYIVTEMGSILENAIKMGADIPSWMSKLLNATLNVVDTAGEKFLDNADKNTGADAKEHVAQNE